MPDLIRAQTGALLLSASLASSLLLGGCAGSDGSQASVDPAEEAGVGPASVVLPFDQVFAALDTVRLDESDVVINVNPTIRLHPRGGLLVADLNEQAIRRYTMAGSLSWQFGRAGSGPGEFSSPTVAIALDSSRIAVADAHERLTIWDERTRDVERTLPYELSSVDDLDVLNDTLILYSSRAVPSATGRARYALHVIDSRDGRTVRSFFTPPITDLNAQLAAVGGWTNSVAWMRLIDNGVVLAATDRPADASRLLGMLRGQLSRASRGG
jgi:hypothetical protein